jgi:hypothetical protein
VIVLGFFAVDTWQNAPETFTAIIAILVAAVLLDRWTRHREPEAGVAAARVVD